MTNWAIPLLALCLPILARGCLQGTSSPAPSPTPTAPSATAVVSVTTQSGPAAPTATVMTAPSPTPAPTIDRTSVATTVEAGQSAIAARQVDPLCLRWEDTDGDGEPEWVGLYLKATDPPRLEGFVLDLDDLDGERWHSLQAPAEDERGLGAYPACRLEVEDVNVDGRAELLVHGRTEDDVDLLHLFVWRESRYELLASFRGDAGIQVTDLDGDPPREILARYDAGRGLVWEQVHTWDGAHYGWTWERYAWLYADRPHPYPTDTAERAVIAFYLALNDRDLPGAYRLFSAAVEASQSYETWAAGFDTMLAVEVGSVHRTGGAGDTATVSAQVRSYDNLDGYVVGRLWDVTWTLVREQGAWQLQRGTQKQLDRWEAPYFP
jgi:hypothetical protein